MRDHDLARALADQSGFLRLLEGGIEGLQSRVGFHADRLHTPLMLGLVARG